MAANTQLRKRSRQGYSTLKLRPAGHQRGRGHHPARVALGNSAVYARSEPEVIGVDDEPSQAPSVAANNFPPAELGPVTVTVPDISPEPGISLQ